MCEYRECMDVQKKFFKKFVNVTFTRSYVIGHILNGELMYAKLLNNGVITKPFPLGERIIHRTYIYFFDTVNFVLYSAVYTGEQFDISMLVRDMGPWRVEPKRGKGSFDDLLTYGKIVKQYAKEPGREAVSYWRLAAGFIRPLVHDNVIYPPSSSYLKVYSDDGTITPLGMAIVMLRLWSIEREKSTTHPFLGELFEYSFTLARAQRALAIATDGEVVEELPIEDLYVLHPGSGIHPDGPYLLIYGPKVGSSPIAIPLNTLHPNCSESHEELGTKVMYYASSLLAVSAVLADSIKELSKLYNSLAKKAASKLLPGEAKLPNFYKLRKILLKKYGENLVLAGIKINEDTGSKRSTSSWRLGEKLLYESLRNGYYILI
jgi:hypothetical protein